MTFFYKRIFPIAWFGLLLLILAFGLVDALQWERFPRLPFLILPAVMMAVGYLTMRKMVFDLVDKVMDAGDALVIIND